MSDDPRQEGPRLRLTQPGPLVIFGLVGVVVGWAQRPVTLQLGGDEPRLGWGAAVLLGFVAACLAGIAWATRRALRDAHRLEAQRAVNRMVLGKASALVGAALLGYYAGRVIGLVDITSELAASRMVQAGVAAVAALSVMVAALALERACLVHDDEDDDLPS